MTLFDIFLVPLYVLIFYFFAQRTVKNNISDPVYRLYYIKGFRYKLFGGISYALIYMYYYKGGDTIEYYYAASPLIRLLTLDPVWFFKFITGIYKTYPEVLGTDVAEHAAHYLIKGSATLTTIRIASVLNIFSCNSFMVLSMLFSVISYQFIWKTFRLMVSLYPSLHKQIAFAFLMIPSPLFWGSGIGKDTIMLGAIMLSFYCFYRLFIQKRVNIKYIFLFLISAYIIALIRGFILFTLIPCFILMAVVYYQNQIRSSVLRFLIGPIFLVLGLSASVLFVKSLGDTVESYKIDSLQKKAEGFHSWHTYLAKTEGGSGYSIGGDISYTPAGILKQAPIAAAIALFGPFPWQIRNVVMLMSGLESLVFLYFTISLLFNRKIYKIIKVLTNDPIIVFSIPFILILAVAIGLTSFNYGALVRYRTPILPFFALAIILIRYHLKSSKT